MTETVGRIYLVRHGRPDHSWHGSFDRQGFGQWLQEYESSSLKTGQEPPSDLQELAVRSEVILSSKLPRAMQTAALLADGGKIEAFDGFQEAPFPAPFAFGLKLSPKVWGTWARIAWMLGLTKGVESRRQASARAEVAAQKLIEQAVRRGDVLLCGHGWFNIMIGRVLKRRGWQRIVTTGHEFWSHSVWAPPIGDRVPSDGVNEAEPVTA